MQITIWEDSEISVDGLKDIVKCALQIIDEAEDSFKARVNKLKKEPDKRTVGIDEVRSIVMEDMWNDIPLELKEKYQRWLEEGRLRADLQGQQLC